MIRLIDIQKEYDNGTKALQGVSMRIDDGEFAFLVGPSGSGKSTTVRCMNFLEEPTSGHVYIDGQELTAKNKTKLVRQFLGKIIR